MVNLVSLDISQKTSQLLARYNSSTQVDDLKAVFTKGEKNDLNKVGEFLIEALFDRIYNPKYLRQLILVYHFLDRHQEVELYCEKFLKMSRRDREILSITIFNRIKMGVAYFSSDVLLRLEAVIGKNEPDVYFFKTAISLRFNDVQNANKFGYELYFRMPRFNELHCVALVEASLLSEDAVLLCETLGYVSKNGKSIYLSRNIKIRAKSSLVAELTKILKRRSESI